MLAALLTGSALAQSSQTVFINGVGLPATTVQKNGQTYYQLSAADLKRVGALTAGGVAPKIDALRGCVGDTLFNGVYTVQLVRRADEDGQHGVVLKVSNASKQKLYNFMLFNPSDVSLATTNAQAVETSNYDNGWFTELLPGTNVTVQPYANTTVSNWTRLLIRPDAQSLKELQEAKLPLAKVYNMEFDLTCTKK